MRYVFMPDWTPEEHARFEVLLKQASQELADTLTSVCRLNREMDEYLAGGDLAP